MKIIVTMECRHDDGYSNHETVEGKLAVIHRDGVILDRLPVVWRDRRAKKNREAGHPWISSKRGPEWEDHPQHVHEIEAWTTFSVRVEP